MKGAYSANDPGMGITVAEVNAAFTVAAQVAEREWYRLDLPKGDPLRLSNNTLYQIVFAEVWRWARMYERSGGKLELPQVIRKQIE